MAKEKEYYFCSECGYKSTKWMGRCPECGEFNTFQEEVKIKSTGKTNKEDLKIYNFDNVEVSKDYRYKTSMVEFDRVLGGGLVKGEVILLTGNPGVGKSTLILQVSRDYAKDGEVVYISGEESPEQIKHRGDRLGISGKNIFILAETEIGNIENYIKTSKTRVVVIDSIQTLHSSEHDSIAGTVTQIRECTLKLIEIAKTMGISIFLIGHITKDGKVAGPKLLEHMVDAVLSFEGDEDMSYRILRSVKNRYGSTNELGIFNMGDDGMTEVTNPSEYFLGEREDRNVGSIVVPIVEGSRVFLLELQALTTNAIFGMPRRVVQGLDYNKVQIIGAVIEKKLGFSMINQDLFMNVPGGITVKEPACDLGAAIAVMSSLKNYSVKKECAAIGELGLRGEVRKVSMILKRLKELEKIGFKEVFVPEGNRKEIEKDKMKIKPIYISNIGDVLNYLKD